MSSRSVPKGIKQIGTLRPNPAPFPTKDPFLFCVYHRDFLPEGDENMEAPRRGNGQDFDSSKPYRMYHGTKIPGFPREYNSAFLMTNGVGKSLTTLASSEHPHRGFETITATMHGLIDHTDSLGNGGRYGQGDLQWMTAGKGIVHAEMFPLVHPDKPNTLQFFQIWLNLPAESKMVDPHFTMHWAEDVVIKGDLENAKITVWAGAFGDLVPPPPPPASWAANPDNEVTVWLLEIENGGHVVLPPARHGNDITRSLYVVEGNGVQVITEEGPTPLLRQQYAEMRGAGVEVQVHHLNEEEEPVKVLVLGGRPIAEPVAQHGPFVMNTQSEIMQCFKDYHETGFGGWPWEKDDQVFSRERTRFALINGEETEPKTCG